MINSSRVLLVEDSISLATVYQAYLSEQPYDVTHVASLAEARDYLDRTTPDILLLDLELPDGNGLDILKQLNAEQRDTGIIIMTAYGSSDLAVDAVNNGAFDFLTKPFDAARLLVTIENATKHQLMNRRLQTFTEILPSALEEKLLSSESIGATNTGPASNDSLVPDPSTIEPLWLTEKRAIENAVAAFDGHVNKAASALEVAPSTLYRKMQSWKEDELSA